MLRVFISYTRQSEDKVRALAADIQALSHTVWCDQELSGGQIWWNEILQEIRNCDVFVFALSQDTLQSEACRSEFKYASDLEKTILPVLVAEDVPLDDLPPELSTIQFLDYVKQDKNAALKLSRSLSKISNSQSLPEPLPRPPGVPFSKTRKESSRSHRIESELNLSSPAGQLKDTQGARARSASPPNISSNGAEKRKIASTIIMCVAFVGLVVLSTYYVQSTLVVVRKFGVYAHWTVLLLVIPLLSGVVLRLVRPANIFFVVGVGSIVTAGILLYLYNQYLFAQPLNPLGGVFYAFVLAGLSYIPNIRLPSRRDVKLEVVKSAKGNRRGVFGFLAGLRAEGVIATLQLLISVLALVFSVVGIFVRSSGHG